MSERKPYPSDVSHDEWAFVAPYLTLTDPEAPQREHSLREVFNGLRCIIRSGATWCMMPNDLPLGGRLPAGATLARGGLVRGHG